MTTTEALQAARPRCPRCGLTECQGPHHTPGPWQVSYHGTGGPTCYFGIHGPDGVRLAEVERSPCRVANAALMAAAPDLAEALASLVWAVNEGIDPKEALAAAYSAQEKAGVL